MPFLDLDPTTVKLDPYPTSVKLDPDPTSGKLDPDPTSVKLDPDPTRTHRTRNPAWYAGPNVTKILKRSSANENMQIIARDMVMVLILYGSLVHL